MTMGRLDEAADDAHLASSEKTEERLRCPQCGAVTTSKARTVLVRATTVSTGLVEIHEHCESCGFDRVSQQTTPRVSTSSGSSGRSSSGFGGGGSSGRGSSGRW
jgi:uncharacterized membrane protein YgcG